MKHRHVLILTYWSYRDALIQTYTLPYVRLIKKNLSPESEIYLVTLEKPSLTLTPAEAAETTRQLRGQGIHWIPIRYFPFGFLAFVQWGVRGIGLLGLIIQRRISAIHCWCTPPGAIGYVLSVLTGRELILDSYEPHAETMIENGTWKRSGLAFRLLFRMEKYQTRRARAVISATEGMRGYAVDKYQVTIKQFVVKPACVDLDLFSERDVKDKALMATLELSGKIVCVYAGKFGGIYLEQEVFNFLRVAYNHWGETFHVLLLTSHTREEIERLCRQSELPPKCVTSTFVKHSDIPKYMGLGDFALTPVKPIPTKQFCTPIKDGEYWALGLPVVIPAHISDDSSIIEEQGIGAVLKGLTEADYQEAVLKIDRLLHLPKAETFERIRAVARRYRSFEIAEKAYQQVYQPQS